jgi:hypothetical protein
VIRFCLALAIASAASAATWIGLISDQHCTPEHKAIRGDDERCIVFVANDRRVYTIGNQDAVQSRAGQEVALTGTIEEQVVIGVTYTTQGIIRVDSVNPISPITLSDAEQAQFQTLMKGMQPKVTAVREVIVAKDKTPLAGNADKLAAAFDEVAAFMRQHHSDDAVRFAEQARDAAKATGAATVQVQQILALRKVTETCTACHLAHRAGKPGEYRIQP